MGLTLETRSLFDVLDEDSRLPGWLSPCNDAFTPAIELGEEREFLQHLLNAGRCSDDHAEIRRLGLIIDVGEDCGDLEALRIAIALGGEALLRATLLPKLSSVAHYFLSNAWEGVRRLTRTGRALHDWEQPEYEKQIIHLRTAVRLGTDAAVEPLRLCQMHTNLGNLLSHCGRLTEAVWAWDSALALKSEFEMALGNRGYGLLQYAQRCHDSGHQVVLLREAHRSLTDALARDSARIHEGARAFFTRTLEDITRTVPPRILRRRMRAPQPAAEWTNAERAYRDWARKRRLFLNVLNDIESGSLAARDVLTLPGITTSFDAPQPSALGFFNQLKQEYVSARYLLYEGLQSDGPHYSDKDVSLVNTLDYPVYGLAAERVRLAFRASYSLLDKIAFFVNNYFRLNIPERQVSFRSLWYVNGSPTLGLRGDLGDRNNAGLKGLFWLSKDLRESDPVFAEAIEPDAQLLVTIRNQLEHKYLKLHSMIVSRVAVPSGVGSDELAFSLTRRDFEAKSLRLLQLVRSALIYLSQAVWAEEHRRHPDDGERIVLPMFLDSFDDEWKE